VQHRSSCFHDSSSIVRLYLFAEAKRAARLRAARRRYQS
jgi:hypothetical protein